MLSTHACWTGHVVGIQNQLIFPGVGGTRNMGNYLGRWAEKRNYDKKSKSRYESLVTLFLLLPTQIAMQWRLYNIFIQAYEDNSSAVFPYWSSEQESRSMSHNLIRKKLFEGQFYQAVVLVLMNQLGFFLTFSVFHFVRENLILQCWISLLGDKVTYNNFSNDIACVPNGANNSLTVLDLQQTVSIWPPLLWSTFSKPTWERWMPCPIKRTMGTEFLCIQREGSNTISAVNGS